ncbi:MAG: hypothetical protein Q4A37_00660 [Candidatus Saccharibacteria bacterium]|nr:hypothetical protein [Candidatus Saccharibacteria bacterium]
MSKARSKKSAPFTLNAVTMRYILSALLLLLLAGMAGSFYFAYTMLHDRATEAANKQAELGSIDLRVQALDTLKKDLAKYKPSVERAANIAASAKSYQYQNQIIDDLKFYATTASVSIDSFSFKDESGSKPAAKPAGSTPATSAPSPTSGSGGAAALKSTQVSIQLGKNVGYTNLLHFLHLIEKNLTRMQIADLSLSRGEDNANVSVQTLTLEVYIR